MKAPKAFLVAAFVAAALLFVACDSSGGSDDDGVTFLDQTLQGTINGKPYVFASGYVEKDDIDDTYTILLYNINPEDGNQPWSFFAYPFEGYLQVMATVPAQVGRTDLFFDLKTGDNKTVTLYDPDADNLNIFAHIGAVEITAIDTTAGTVTGRIAASNGEGDEVNGNFTVSIEPAD